MTLVSSVRLTIASLAEPYLRVVYDYTSINMKLSAIASALDVRLENGSPDTEITGLNGIEQAGPGELTFVSNPKYSAAARTTKASAVIVGEDFPAIPAAMLRAKDPYLTFAQGAGTVSPADTICAWSASDRGRWCQRTHRSKCAHWAVCGDRRGR